MPKTTFGMRANSVVREPEIQKLWDDNEVLKKVVDNNNGVGCLTDSLFFLAVADLMCIA